MYVVVHDRAELKNAGLEHLLTHSYTLHNPCHIAMYMYWDMLRQRYVRGGMQVTVIKAAIIFQT